MSMHHMYTPAPVLELVSPQSLSPEPPRAQPQAFATRRVSPLENVALPEVRIPQQQTKNLLTLFVAQAITLVEV